MGRPKNPNSRRSKAAAKRAARLLEVGQPNDRIRKLREVYSFVIPTKGPDGRGGNIDQDVCDGIGQLCAVGLLDGHGYEARDLRDSARFFRDHYWIRFRPTGPKTSKSERSAKSEPDYAYLEAGGAKYEAMDEALSGYERAVLFDAVVDKNWGDELSPWINGLVCEELLRRGKLVDLFRFPTAEDYARLLTLIRGLCAIHEATIAPRYRRAA